MIDDFGFCHRVQMAMALFHCHPAVLQTGCGNPDQIPVMMRRKLWRLVEQGQFTIADG